MSSWFQSISRHIEERPAWTLIGAIAIVAICFANSIPNDFILDDYAIVATNPAIRTISPLHDLMTPYWGKHSTAGIYRPLTILSFSFEYPLWHRWAGGYRLTNLVIHTINGFLVFLLARSLLQTLGGALLAGAIYLVHPVHTEPVVGLVGRSELLSAMFCLLAWLLFRRRRTALCILAFALSLLSKENAIAFPAVILLDTWFSEGNLKGLLQSCRRFGAVLSAALGYLMLRFSVLHRITVPDISQYGDGHLTFAQRELTMGRGFLKYFHLLLAPIDVTGDYDFNSIPISNASDWFGWMGLITVLAVMIFAVWMWRRDRKVAFGILFFYLTIFPVSNWLIPTGVLMAERFLYLPSVGLCLIAGWIWNRLPQREFKPLLAGGLLATAALLCISHNYIWRDQLTYFGNMVRVLPDNVRGRQGYGVALVEAGRPDLAMEQFQAGLRIMRQAPLLAGLAESEMELDRDCSRARPALEEALQMQPGDPFARWLLGACFEREGFVTEAEAEYRQAIAVTEFPDPKLLVAWGRALQKTGRLDESQEAYRRAALLK
jgi:protein O-mannosyl-transferase